MMTNRLGNGVKRTPEMSCNISNIIQSTDNTQYICGLLKQLSSQANFWNYSVWMQCRGKRVNGGHLREMQAKTKTISKVENLHEWAFSLKGVLRKYAVWNSFNTTKIFQEVITEGVALTGIPHPQG
jgi:hypothetical protein